MMIGNMQSLPDWYGDQGRSTPYSSLEQFRGANPNAPQFTQGAAVPLPDQAALQGANEFTNNNRTMPGINGQPGKTLMTYDPQLAQRDSMPRQGGGMPPGGGGMPNWYGDQGRRTPYNSLDEFRAANPNAPQFQQGAAVPKPDQAMLQQANEFSANNRMPGDQQLMAYDANAAARDQGRIGMQQQQFNPQLIRMFQQFMQQRQGRGNMYGGGGFMY